MTSKALGPELKEVAVVGAAGRMGEWFARYFSSRVRLVRVYDVKPIKVPIVEGYNIEVSNSLKNCVNRADAIFICVPVSVMPKLIRTCSVIAKQGAFLAEISSIKKKSFASLTRTRLDIHPICVHPMFGPGASDRRLRWVVVPVRDLELEMSVLSRYFPYSTFARINSWSEHDKAMGIILGLTYFVNLAFGDVISKSELTRLLPIAGTTFTLQSMLAQSIVAEEPELISAVISSNPTAAASIRGFLRSCEKLQRSMRDEKSIKLLSSSIRTRLEKTYDLNESYQLMYRALDNLSHAKS